MWISQALMVFRQTARVSSMIRYELPLLASRREFGGLLSPSDDCSARRLLQPCDLMHVEQVRWRKRGINKPLSKQQKAIRRQAREEKEAKRKEFTFIERCIKRRSSNLSSISFRGPGRFDAEEEAKSKEDPVLDVFIQADHKTQFYSVKDSLALHRQVYSPAMFNRPNAPVKLRIELNMTTEKATKMIPSSEEIVPVPFPFKHNEKRTILAFAGTKEKQEEAIEAGAEVALGADMIKKVLKGQFNVGDFDFCVATTDMAVSLASLRGILKSRCPTKFNGKFLFMNLFKTHSL